MATVQSELRPSESWLQPDYSAASVRNLARKPALFINNTWVNSTHGATLALEDPSSSKEICRIVDASDADVDRAVAAARAAFDDGRWSNLPPNKRERIINKLADLIESHAAEFAELEAIDNGKPVGCTLVLKPAEQTSLTALRLADFVVEAGFPPGVVNVITGNGHTAGDRLVKHPDVDKVAFTGSTEVGKLINRNATDSMKRVTLELGGKSPVVVMPDVNVDEVAKGASMSVVREEIFGPVVVAQRFEDLDEVAKAANDTCYGLGAGIWTKDVSAMHRLAAKIRAGTVWGNCHAMIDPALPFGGYKQSGFGREQGRQGI